MAEISTIDGIAEGDIDTVDLLAKASISNINGYTFPVPSQDIDVEYDFNSQTTQEAAASDWAPSGDAENWVNGADAVNQTFWAQPEDNNDVVKGWNCGFGGTGSGGTGPNGGVDTSDGTHNTGERYIYTEASGQHLKCKVMRMPGSNFSTEMTDTSADLNLKFWVHAYGSNMGNLYIYIDTQIASNHTEATLLETYIGSTLNDDFTANSSVWVQKTISLNSYRAVNATHFIYFISQGATSFRSDLSIDSVIIEEG